MNSQVQKWIDNDNKAEAVCIVACPTDENNFAVGFHSLLFITIY